MLKQLEALIVKEYLTGKGSTLISKEFKISKDKILYILNKKKLIRKRNRCSSLEIKQIGESFIIEKSCSKCKKNITYTSKHKTICCRNYFNSIKKKSLCKLCSLELQNGPGNPFYGKTHKIETKEKISKSRKGKGTGDTNAMSNMVHREKAKINLLKRWDSGELEHIRKKMSLKLKETIISGKIKSSPISKKEKEIYDFLTQKGFEVIQTYPILTKTCDIYIPQFNLIIEYFGDYWHCNPTKYDADYFNQKKQKYAIELWDYDKKKLELIKSFGYNLEVVWESDLRYNNKLLEKIISKYETKFNSTPKWSRKDQDSCSPI